MSRARPVYPGAVLFSTRRVHKRQLLLRPSAAVNQLIEYVVAVCAQRYGVELHALCVMSNHVHDVVTDRHGCVVEFERDCHAIIARALNALHGDFESLWSRAQSCRVTCVESEVVIDKIAYTMANPVAAGLVAHGASWPGVRGAWPMQARTIRRPPGFFRDSRCGGSWPDEVVLEFHRPPGYAHLSDDEMAAHVREKIELQEALARDVMRAANRRFLGRRKVRLQSRYSYPLSREERFGLRPAVAAHSKPARIEALQEYRAWLEEYETARERLRKGESFVRFPYGTWKMRVYYRFPCGPPSGDVLAA